MERIAWTQPKLEVRDLQVVLAVAAAGSTAKAATTLHLTQSAVSRALVLAEDKLGVRLFERRARGLAPTAAGERLLSGAGALLAQLGELERYAGDAVATATKIRVVCECYTAYRWLPSALAALRDKLQSIEVTLPVEHSVDPVAALLAREVDVALLTTSPVRGALRDRPLFADEIVFVVAPSHPLAARAQISPAELAAHVLISSTNASRAEARSVFASIYGRALPKLQIVRLPLTEAILDMARAGMGVAVLSEWVASGYLDRGDLIAKRLTTGPVRRPWRIAYRREAEDAAQMLASVLATAPPRLAPPSRRARRA